MHKDGWGYVRMLLGLGLAVVIIVPLYKIAANTILPRLGLDGVNTWVQSA